MQVSKYHVGDQFNSLDPNAKLHLKGFLVLVLLSQTSRPDAQEGLQDIDRTPPSNESMAQLLYERKKD